MGSPTQLDSTAPSLDRRRLLRGAVAGAAGLAAWHAPGVRVHDLRGARALASASGPLSAMVTATSNTVTQGGKTYQSWNTSGSPTFYTVPFPTGDVQVRVRNRATERTPGQSPNGDWLLVVNTVPTGCTSCEVTAISMTCPTGTPDVTGVPGGGLGNVHCDNSPPDVTTAVTATFTVTCT